MHPLFAAVDWIGISTLVGVALSGIATIITALRANAAATQATQAAKNTTTSNGTNLATTVEQIHANTSAIRSRASDPAAPVVITKEPAPGEHS